MTSALAAALFDDQETVERWTAEQFVIHFWDLTCATVASEWKRAGEWNHMADIYELQGVAGESLVKHSRAFPQWATERQLDPQSRRLFWATLKKRVDWDLKKYLANKLTITESFDAILASFNGEQADEWYSTRTTPPPADHLLHRALVQYLTTLPEASQIVVMLSFFEEMTEEAIANLLLMERSSVQYRRKRATEKLLHHAKRQVFSEPLDDLAVQTAWFATWETPATFNAWIARTYGVADADLYLNYGYAHLRADPSYLVDILDVANGRRINRVNTSAPPRRGAKASLTDETVREVRRRKADGQTLRTIAAEMRLPYQGVGDITRGNSYRYVT